MTLRTIKITSKLPDYEKIKKLAKEAFPPKEYLAPSVLIKMAESPDFDFLALYDSEHFAGYMAVRRYKEMTYLFFLAIDAESRSLGYGSRAIETLKALYPDTQYVVDMEMLDENASNARQREKRRHFYLQNGFKPTGIFFLIAVPGFRPKYFEREIR
ncbi:MAG: GNAT family N-acetyltransferase [Christensenellaceae bacterium]